MDDNFDFEVSYEGVESSYTYDYEPTEDEWAWLAGFYDNCGVVIDYNKYNRIVFTHKSYPVLQKLELITKVRPWFQHANTTKPSQTGRITISGSSAMDLLVKMGPHLYVREKDAQLAREFLSKPDERVFSMTNDEIVANMIARSATLYRGGQPRKRYLEWYYVRFKEYTPPPEDPTLFWPYVAGVLESRTPIVEINNKIGEDAKLPFTEVIWLTRKWLCERYGFSDLVDDLPALPSKFTVDVLEHIWPYTAQADQSERELGEHNYE